MAEVVVSGVQVEMPAVEVGLFGEQLVALALF